MVNTANFIASANNALGQAIIDDTSRSLGTMSHPELLGSYNDGESGGSGSSGCYLI